jgi:hypothetical protein
MSESFQKLAEKREQLDVPYCEAISTYSPYLTIWSLVMSLRAVRSNA